MRAAPAAIGGMPRSSKRASERQSATSSRSPCTTWMAIAVWPSLKVVKSCALAVGMVLLRAMMRSTRPPMVSMPERERDHVEQQQLALGASCPPARWPGSRGAERDHFVRVRGRSAAGGRRARRPPRAPAGMRVEPPTMTHALHLGHVDLGIAQRPCARRRSCGRPAAGRGVELPRGDIATRAAAAELALERRLARRVGQRLLGRAGGDQHRALVARRVGCSRPRVRQRPVGEQRDRSRRRRARESPPVATTSNTPRVRRSSETSKVPPPRS